MTLSDALQDAQQVTVEVTNPEQPFGAVQVFTGGLGTGGESPTGGAVSSVFGRTGDILPVCSDYATCYAPIGTAIPAGGLLNQILGKTGASDYETGWITNPSVTLPLLLGKSRIMSDGSLLLFNTTTGKYHEITLTGPDGAVYPVYGPGVA